MRSWPGWELPSQHAMMHALGLEIERRGNAWRTWVTVLRPLVYEFRSVSRKESRSGKTVFELGPVVTRFADPDGLDRQTRAAQAALGL